MIIYTEFILSDVTRKKQVRRKMNTDEQKIYQSGLTQTLNNKLTCQRARRKKRRKA